MAGPSPWSFLSPFQQVFDNFWNQPVTNWGRFFNPQVVFNYNPEDEGVESHVLRRVGSYGSQLATLIDVLELLRKRLPPSTELDRAEQAALVEFDRIRTEADKAVKEYRGIDPEDLLRRLADLRDQDPAAFAAVCAGIAELQQPVDPVLVPALP